MKTQCREALYEWTAWRAVLEGRPVIKGTIVESGTNDGVVRRPGRRARAHQKGSVCGGPPHEGGAGVEGGHAFGQASPAVAPELGG